MVVSGLFKCISRHEKEKKSRFTYFEVIARVYVLLTKTKTKTKFNFELLCETKKH